MKSLPTLLNEFSPAPTVDGLSLQFEAIAKAALFGGYFSVNEDEYRIYLLDIEFYFNSENGGVTEPAMYHQGRDLPFFPKGSLCPNQSGVDVTFEDDENKSYRASFLIRGYKFVQGKEEYVNNTSSKNYSPRFLWDDLFGNASCVGVGKRLVVEWKNEEYSEDCKVKVSTRVNLNGLTAERPWRFSKID